MDTTTKIVNVISEIKTNPVNYSLLKKIQLSLTEDNVKFLLKTGNSYHKASIDTKKKWEIAAVKRISELMFK